MMLGFLLLKQGSQGPHRCLQDMYLQAEFAK